MAKDPAVLLYVQDFLIGSSLLSPLQKGHYITLLCYQQQSDTGSLTEAEISLRMGKDFKQHWPVIRQKFKEDEHGFYNQRMRSEIERRQKTSRANRENVEKRWGKKHTTVLPPYENGKASVIPFVETEIETEIETGLGKSENLLTDLEIGKTIEFIQITCYIQLTEKQVADHWQAFRINEKYSRDRNDQIRHFRNWLKKQPHEKSKRTTTDPARPGRVRTAF